MSIIEKLYNSEVHGEALGSGFRSAEDTRVDSLLDKPYHELLALQPEEDTQTQNRIFFLIGDMLRAKGLREYQRGIRFAVQFMSEATRPETRGIRDPGMSRMF